MNQQKQNGTHRQTQLADTNSRHNAAPLLQTETVLKQANQSADIKIEGNAEYRFKLFWIIEGALFLDIGNIWAINELNNEVDLLEMKKYNENSVFRFNKFYKDLAVGTGFGTRFDFSFFVFRLDVGMKLRDPIFADKNKWIINNRNYNKNDFNFTIGIGYPF